MGKKSRRTIKSTNDGGTSASLDGTRYSHGDEASSMVTSSSLPPISGTDAAVAAAAAVYYPSDGPSDVELLQTTSASLQTKLDQLTQLGLANDRSGFVQQFVPMDLSYDDQQRFLHDLTVGPEAENQWQNLVSEIAAIRSGMGVDRIEGDQITRATFFFTHPIQQQCDREVSFVCCSRGSSNSSSTHDGRNNNHNSINNAEWRAEG
jgi:hypothetical protein